MIAAGVAGGLTYAAINTDLASALVQGLSVSVIGFTVYAAIAVRRTNKALVAARHELAGLAVADERSRIARDLHDTLGHSLSVIALKSELAARLVDEEPARARAEMEDVQRVARDSLSAVRETIGGYRQASLATELAGARSALQAAGIEGRVEPAPEGLPAATDAILGWAVREGVTNILRHGRARAAEIRVESDPSAVAVEIRNDRDPDRDAFLAETTPSGAGGRVGGTGLAGLRERVATVGGVVEAGGLPDGGFRLRVSIPIA
jgi:two-component system, NarL family, sensor histidine kinase DesK